MLICEYQCRECGLEFERMRSLDDNSDVECPRCGSSRVKNTATLAASCSGGSKPGPAAPPGRRS